MYPHQAERLTEALERAGVGALVATTAANVAYVTGFRTPRALGSRGDVRAIFSPRGTALVTPLVLLGAVADADVTHVVAHGAPLFAGARAASGVGARVREWSEHAAATAAEATVVALERLGIGGPVGVDEGDLTPPAWQALVERLAPRPAVPASARLAQARAVKSPYEIECLVHALGILEEGVNAVIQMLKPGVTEREAAAACDEEIRRRGGAPTFTVVLTGDRTGLPVAAPSDRALRRGDLATIDAGCVARGYHATVARTAVMGDPTPDQDRLHQAIQDAQEAAMAAIRPGVPAARVLAAARAALPDAPLPSAGHGIGLDPVESPALAPDDDTPLEPGMVLTVDVPYWIPERTGLCVKDTVLVTTDGHRALNRAARGLVVLD